MASKVPNAFAFVPADGLGRAKAVDRKLIRSHCMKGKNKRKAVHARVFHPTLASIETPEAIQAAISFSRRSMSSGSQSSDEFMWWNAESDSDCTENANERQSASRIESSLLRPPPPDLSLVKFVGETDCHSRELFCKYFATARSVVYSIDSNVDFDTSKIIWFQWLFDDIAYFHSILLSTSVLNDFVAHKPFAKTTYFHLRKTIAFLNERLSDSVLSLQDSTIAVVIILIRMADACGDHVAAKAHTRGLQQMVRLRGGLEDFRDNTKLHIKIRHLDLCLALDTGEEPQFSPKQVSWNPIFNITPQASASYVAECLTDPRLVILFRDLQRLATLMNASTRGAQRLQETEFQDYTYSIQYRLLRLQGKLDRTLDECIRLAMLAFLRTTFPVYGRARHPYLCWRFRECCRALEEDHEATTPQLQDLVLWMLAVGAMSIQGFDKPWMHEFWHANAPNLTWPLARQRLQAIMWIDSIHDEPGRQAFEAMCLGLVD